MSQAQVHVSHATLIFTLRSVSQQRHARRVRPDFSRYQERRRLQTAADSIVYLSIDKLTGPGLVVFPVRVHVQHPALHFIHTTPKARLYILHKWLSMEKLTGVI